MKIKNKKKMILTLLLVALIILAACDFYIIRIRNDKQYSLNNNSVKKKTEDMHKTFNYGDILNTIDKCSSEFVLIKIEKNSTSKNFINTQVKYKGRIEGLMKGLKIMKMQEIIKSINELNIEKTDNTENNEYIAEINVDFLKFK